MFRMTAFGGPRSVSVRVLFFPIDFLGWFLGHVADCVGRSCSDNSILSGPREASRRDQRNGWLLPDFTGWE